MMRIMLVTTLTVQLQQYKHNVRLEYLTLCDRSIR
jgi:hypothetical protein